MFQRKRKQYFVDRKVQGALTLRTIVYWGFYILSITIMLLCWRIITGPARLFYTHLDEMWIQFGPALIASFLMLPLVVTDMVRLSNRFAGPMFRVRRAMRQLARGEEVDPVHFRDGDFWQEFADDFNSVLAIVNERREAAQTEQPADVAESTV